MDMTARSPAPFPYHEDLYNCWLMGATERCEWPQSMLIVWLVMLCK